jgi:hypothetical protein
MKSVKYWSNLLAREDDAVPAYQGEFCPLLLPLETLRERIRITLPGNSLADINITLNSLRDTYMNELDAEREGWRKAALAEAISVASGYSADSIARFASIVRSDRLPGVGGHIWFVVAYCQRPRALCRLVDSLLEEFRRFGRSPRGATVLVF